MLCPFISRHSNFTEIYSLVSVLDKTSQHCFRLWLGAKEAPGQLPKSMFTKIHNMICTVS